jgi:anti-sigma B factor antagonist
MTDAVPQDREPLRAHQLIELGDLSLTSEREGVVHTISLAGELDLATATALQDELTRVEAGDASSIILDLSGLAFIDSTGIRLLLGAAIRSRADSQRLTLLRGGPAVQRALQITAVEDQLPFAD